jgi:hypothetical protein
MDDLLDRLQELVDAYARQASPPGPAAARRRSRARRRATGVAVAGILVAGVAAVGLLWPQAAHRQTLTRLEPTRPTGWQAVHYHGLAFYVPGTWRVRDARQHPCAASLPGPAVVVGHPDVPLPCPSGPRRRAPLLWVDSRAGEQPPANAAATTINGLTMRVLRLHPGDLGWVALDGRAYRPVYPHGSGVEVWVMGEGLQLKLVDPAGGTVADQILATLHHL